MADRCRALPYPHSNCHSPVVDSRCLDPRLVGVVRVWVPSMHLDGRFDVLPMLDFTRASLRGAIADVICSLPS